MTGTIKKLLHQKGFGFIAASDGKEYFFHWSNVGKHMSALDGYAEGDKVAFEVEESAKGPRASNVRKG